MIALIQRVSEASVSVEGNTIGKIGEGIVIFLGVFDDDTEADAFFLASRCAHIRIFEDANDAMNLSLLEIKGPALSISQFTLCANARKGRRPGFSDAMEPGGAKRLYERFCDDLSNFGVHIEKGIFGERMIVKIANDGPVTFILNSRESRRGNLKSEE